MKFKFLFFIFFHFVLIKSDESFYCNENLNLKIFINKRGKCNSTKRIIASIFGILASGFLFFSKNSSPETQKLGALGAIHSAQALFEVMAEEEDGQHYRLKNREQVADLISKFIKNEKFMEISMKKILELSQKSNLET